MPLFTRTFQIIAGILSVPVLGVAVIGTAYPSPFLDHLADLVNGSQTTTVDSTNAPNWSFGLPLAQPTLTSIATTTGGTLPNATTFYFQVAALDGNGTTTVSTNLSGITDSTSEALQVTWGSVTGATGYALYFSTSTPTSFTQYFLATSTTASYTFSTSTGSLSGSYTKSDTTAFAALINPNGTSYLNGGALQVNSGSTQTAGYFYGSTNNFIQSVIHNTNSGNNASADFVACNNLSKVLWPLGANCPNYYVDFGINSSAFNQAAFSGESANDAFLASSDSNLDIETASTTGPAAINFLTGGTLSSNIRMTIGKTGLVRNSGTAPTAATSSGAGTGSVPVTIAGSPNFFNFNIITGASPSGSNATVATFTLPAACPTATVPLVENSNANADALGVTAFVYASSTGPSTFVLNSGVTALTAATNYVWNIYVGCY